MPAPTRLLLTGPVAIDGDEPTRVELWANDRTAVAFAAGFQVGVLTALKMSMTEDRRLRVTGLDPDGVPTLWTATEPERVTTRWAGARVTWPDGKISVGATVTGTQYGVTVHHEGETTDLPGARMQAVGSQRWIVDGDTRILSSDGRGCGCGGRRR